MESVSRKTAASRSCFDRSSTARRSPVVTAAGCGSVISGRIHTQGPVDLAAIRLGRRCHGAFPREGCREVSVARPATSIPALPDGRTWECPDDAARSNVGRLRAGQLVRSQWPWRSAAPPKQCPNDVPALLARPLLLAAWRLGPAVTIRIEVPRRRNRSGLGFVYSAHLAGKSKVKCRKTIAPPSPPLFLAAGREMSHQAASPTGTTENNGRPG